MELGNTISTGIPTIATGTEEVAATPVNHQSLHTMAIATAYAILDSVPATSETQQRTPQAITRGHPRQSDVDDDENDDPDGPQPDATCHGRKWFKEATAIFNNPVNRPHPYHTWHLKMPKGDKVYLQSNTRGYCSRLDIFLSLFPKKVLINMVRYTNKGLQEDEKKKTTKGKMLKFIGMMMLTNFYEFVDRRSFWSNTALGKYVMSPKLGSTGMSRNRFNNLWRYLRIGDQPEFRPEGMSSEQYQWLLTDPVLMPSAGIGYEIFIRRTISVSMNP